MCCSCTEGETSDIAVGDESLLKQNKINTSEVPAAVDPKLASALSVLWPLTFCRSSPVVMMMMMMMETSVRLPTAVHRHKEYLS